MQTDVAHLPLPEASEISGAPTLPAAWIAVGVAASLLVAGWIVVRRRAGLPVVAARPHDPVPWGGIDVLQVVLILLATAFAGEASLVSEAPLANQLAVRSLATAVGTIFSMAYLCARGATLRDLGLADVRLRADLGLALAALALVVAPVLACAYLVSLLVPYEHHIVDLLRQQRGWSVLAIVILSAVVVAPVAEELFFRRVLQGWLEKRLPRADGGWAVALAAVAFAAAHQGQGLALVPLFPLALVLGHLVRRTGSIVPSILLHALFNAVSLAILLLHTPGPTPPAG